MNAFKFKINSTIFSLFVALYFTICLNMSLMRQIYEIFINLESPNPIMIVSVFFFFVAAFNLLFIPFTIKYIEKPVFIAIILTASLVNFGMYQYKIIFDPDMMANIFETTSAEAGSYFNMTFLVWFVVTGMLPAFLIYNAEITHFKWNKDLLFKGVSIAISIAVILVIAAFFYKDYASIARNNHSLRKQIVPTYYIASTFKYIKHTYFYTPMAYTTIGEDAHLIAHDKKNLTVFIVGETARAQNYQLNGYKRETNAYSKGIKNIIAFQKATSCGTATAISLPCMFSTMNKKTYSRKIFENQDNVVDILNRAGVDTFWAENNTGCKGICDKIEYTLIQPKNPDYCDGATCTDDIFLTDLQERIDTMKGKDGIIFLHIMGSHGPTYFKRYPDKFKKFTPDCPRSDIQNCTDEEITNTYDNTILFTDYVMAQVIETLKNNTDNFNPSMLYMSDHGESLGERGIYLHGMPYSVAPEMQTHVPLIVWVPDTTVKAKGIDMACLKKDAQEKNVSHDNVSHTLMGMMGVQTHVYDPAMDIFFNCSTQNRRVYELPK